MKVLLINGSPHEHGSTDFALNKVAKSLNDEGIETLIFWIGDEPIGSFSLTHKYEEDDVVSKALKLMKESDALVLGSPVHYASAPGNFISFLDRLFYSNRDIDTFRLKPAAAIASARRAGTTATFDELNKYFTIAQMPIISSTYWNNIHGSNAIDASKDEEGIATMINLGKNMAYFLKLIELGKEEVKKPQIVKARTNFIR